jgi:cytochrome c oxidase cbb3-type subunit 3
VQSLPPSRLQQVIREGLPGTSMPAWQSVLKPAEIEAISAYVQRVMFRRDG